MRDAHALAAAAGRRLDHHRITDFVGDRRGLFGIGDLPEIAGHGRDLGRGRGFLGFDLVAHRRDGLGIGPDKDDPGRRQGFRERFALGQEPVTGMYGLGAGLFAGVDDLVDDQVALGRGGRPDKDGIVRHLNMQRVAVGLGKDRDGLYPHAPRRLDDPAGNLAAIGDQYSLEHAPLSSTDPLGFAALRQKSQSNRVQHLGQ